MALLSPLQNGAAFSLDWIQTRPVVTQRFGINRHIYEQFGMEGHNGIDFRAPIGSHIFAPMDGIVRIKDTATQGYGLHIRIRNEFKACELVLGHLSTVCVQDGARVNMGDKIGYSGNSGFSTGAHLHMGYRLLKDGDPKDIFSWQVLDYKNGYFGYIDPEEYLICWKGGLLKNSF